jgi:hypothetical protein
VESDTPTIAATQKKRLIKPKSEVQSSNRSQSDCQVLATTTRVAAGSVAHRGNSRRCRARRNQLPRLSHTSLCRQSRGRAD